MTSKLTIKERVQVLMANRGLPDDEYHQLLEIQLLNAKQDGTKAPPWLGSRTPTKKVFKYRRRDLMSTKDYTVHRVTWRSKLLDNDTNILMVLRTYRDTGGPYWICEKWMVQNGWVGIIYLDNMSLNRKAVIKHAMKILKEMY